MKKNYDFKILDLFSGAGGFSYGIDNVENFKTVLALDNNLPSLNTLKYNLKNTKIICGDITVDEIKEKTIKTARKLGVNMIIGGPPCQGFSLKGKNLGLKDPRNFLFLEFYNIVKELKPEIFVLENVKSIITTADGYFIKEINKLFSDLGYFINFGVLNTSNFGIPQNRERTIIIGCLTQNITLPTILSKKKVTVKDAISDLAYLNSGEGEIESLYKKEPLSLYQQKMRKNSIKLFNHKATNHNSIALYKLSLIPPEKGKEYLPKHLLGKQKFNTTWSRLEWNNQSPTIDTRFDTPSNGRNSHPELNRAITPREAARIQGFPDNFIFLGNKTDICRQIGNAVPPILGEVIAKNIMSQLTRENFSKNGITLYNDDSQRIIQKLINDKIIVNHIITDPPYNISQENNFDTLKNPRVGVDFGEWDKNFNLYNWIDDYSKIISKNGSFIIFCSYRFLSHIIDRLENNDFIVKDVIKWIKTNPMPRNRDRRYVQDTEFAVWAVKKGAKWVFNRSKEKSYLRAEFHTSVVSGLEKTDHPTQKSLELMRQIIEIHTNENDIIMDPFMGSGTTGTAAYELYRKFIGIEIEPHYYELAKNRIFNFKRRYKSQEYGFNKLYALLTNFYETSQDLSLKDYINNKYEYNFDHIDINYNEKLVNLLKEFINKQGIEIKDLSGDISDFYKFNLNELENFIKITNSL